jgi:light-regulated signal transduction histidine kinase (bacteriophytochrome)
LPKILAMPASLEPWPLWALIIVIMLFLALGLLLLLLWQTRAQARGADDKKAARAGPAPQNEPSTSTPQPTGNTDHDAFSYTMSHDLRAPIRVVEGFTKILKEDYGAQLDRIGNDHLDRVLGAASRMNQMIDALLALSQLSNQPLGRQNVNLSQLALYIADDLRREQPERTVQFHIAAGLTTQGDPTLLRVVLENLLGNAWKYTSKRPDAEIWFAPHSEHAHTYTVRDNGAGFDMRFADRLFGVFQRLHSANDFAGTGVGLASVKRIVQRHGGDIWAQAEVYQGAAFHFSLRPQEETPGRAQVFSSPKAGLPQIDRPGDMQNTAQRA